MTAAAGAIAGLALAAAITGCGLRTSRRVTGTCHGACDHYLACKRTDDTALRDRCLRECPDVFGDAESLRAFEELSCRDTVEFVDGRTPRTSATPR